MVKGNGDFTGWRETYSRRLREVLGLNGSPVAVAYADEPAANASEGKYRACGATASARDGAVINLDRSSCACLGGVDHLGLAGSANGVKDLLRCWFLAHGERLWHSVSGARQTSRHTAMKAPPPTARGAYIVFSPLERAEFAPDLVQFLCNPEQACRLVALARYRVGVLPPIDLEGSLCWNTITYPLVTGNINISLGDTTARRIERWDPTELVVSVPTPKLHQIVASMDSCAAGTAPPLWRLAQSPARVRRAHMETRRPRGRSARAPSEVES